MVLLAQLNYNIRSTGIVYIFLILGGQIFIVSIKTILLTLRPASSYVNGQP